VTSKRYLGENQALNQQSDLIGKTRPSSSIDAVIPLSVCFRSQRVETFKSFSCSRAALGRPRLSLENSSTFSRTSPSDFSRRIAKVRSPTTGDATKESILWRIFGLPNVRANTNVHTASPLRTNTPTPFVDKRSDHFVTTRWSVILSCADAGGDEQKTRKALADLSKIYWRPVFAFICRQGHSVPDAQDLTQDFFVMVLKGRLLQHADRNRGRFRSIVLKALKDFLRDAAEKRHARKRGGDVQFVSWDEWMAEAPSRLWIPTKESESWSPERIFDVRWAATVVERALRRLGDECEKRGRRRVFDVLSVCLTGERENVSCARFSKTLGLSEVATKSLVHRLRERYRALVREEVARTVEKTDEIEDELRYLCSVLSAAK
jgi:DNA-directed RNA polymerase specialized sigma24 family protein